MPENQKSVPKKKAQPHWLQQQVLQRLLQTEESVEVVKINGERVRGVFDTYSILQRMRTKAPASSSKYGVSAIHGGKGLLNGDNRSRQAILERAWMSFSIPKDQKFQ